MNNGNKSKKAKGTKKCVIKQKLEFEFYKHCLEATLLENIMSKLTKIKLIWIVKTLNRAYKWIINRITRSLYFLKFMLFP